MPLPRFDPICPTSVFPIQIGGKWTAMIVLCLHTGPRRFGVLRRHLSPISAKVLKESLTAMERDGLVLRRPFEGTDSVGGGVEYELTPLGLTLLGLIEQVRGWSRENLAELWSAREAFDRAEAA
ncbi:MAG TPA: helix-turn-helix domain-containing protein [Actinocrinis sp.]|nr:helix-turn-helix domain-containing protein [Actinocrinis sp.]